MVGGSAFSAERLGELARSAWRRGGLDTLVKVAPFLTRPDPALPVGYCTALKYLLGRTPAEMEQVTGLVEGGTLAAGAEIFTVAPMPEAGAFDLKGYSPSSSTVAIEIPGYVSHSAYPPGRGAPLWDLARVSQSCLVLLASLPRGVVFRYEVRRLPPLR